METRREIGMHASIHPSAIISYIYANTCTQTETNPPSTITITTITPTSITPTPVCMDTFLEVCERREGSGQVPLDQLHGADAIRSARLVVVAVLASRPGWAITAVVVSTRISILSSTIGTTTMTSTTIASMAGGEGGSGRSGWGDAWRIHRTSRDLAACMRTAITAITITMTSATTSAAITSASATTTSAAKNTST